MKYTVRGIIQLLKVTKVVSSLELCWVGLLWKLLWRAYINMFAFPGTKDKFNFSAGVCVSFLWDRQTFSQSGDTLLHYNSNVGVIQLGQTWKRQPFSFWLLWYCDILWDSNLYSPMDNDRFQELLDFFVSLVKFLFTYLIVLFGVSLFEF